MLKPPDQLLRLVVQLAQFGMTHLVDALHLPDQQFGIANHFERFDLVFGGIAESGDQSLILSVVISVVPKIFAKLGDRVAGGVLNSHTITGRPRIAASSAINVSGMSGRSRFRHGKKITGPGRTKSHEASLQRSSLQRVNPKPEVEQQCERLSSRPGKYLLRQFDRD